MPSARPTSRPRSTIDQLIIRRENEIVDQLPLDRNQLTIGSDRDNDIVLPETTVSRYHAQIARSSDGRDWEIEDLGSTNGTDLDGNRLIPLERVSWPTGFFVRVGPFFLEWVAASRPKLPPKRDHAQPVPPPPSAPSSPPVPDRQMPPLRMEVDVSHMVLDPGKSDAIKLILTNRGENVLHCTISIEGLKHTWYSIEGGNLVRLMKFKRDQLPEEKRIVFTLPKDSSATAGEHPFRIVIASKDVDGRGTSIAYDCILEITVFDDVQAVISPSQIVNGKESILQVFNRGNTTRKYQIKADDKAHEVDFKFPASKTLTVPQGQNKSLPIVVSAKNRLWTGTPKSHLFNLAVHTSPTAPPLVTQSGSVLVNPVFPRWFMSLLPLLLLFLCGTSSLSGTIIWRSIESNRNAVSTQAAFALGTEQAYVIGTADAVATASENKRREDIFNANLTATAVQITRVYSVTVTAESDADNDGLPLYEELENETDPNLSDTDGDGLTDRDEVKKYNTIPIIFDSDGDGLSDGVEVNETGTSPTDADTDDDGLKDGVDPDPVRVPIPTPLPAPTLRPTAVPPTPTPFVLKVGDVEIDMVEVPASAFRMGAAEGDTLAESFEKENHWVSVRRFWISKTEITNGQYLPFVDAQPDQASLPVCETRSNSEPSDEEVPEPTPFPEPLTNHPAVCLTFNDVNQYVQWLSAETGNQVLIPSESEWEKAARGDRDQRIYPWGSGFQDYLLNYCDAGCQESDAWQDRTYSLGLFTRNVGSFPGNASPYGALDMSGNVLEWTRSRWGDTWDAPSFGYPYNANDGRESRGGASTFYVIRGGGFITEQNNVRVSARERIRAGDRHAAVGFRIVVYDE